MRPFLKRVWHEFWNDEQLAARLWRGLLIGYSVSGAGLGAMLTTSPLWVRVSIFVSAGVAGVVGGLIAIGQKNPSPEQVVDLFDKGIQATQISADTMKTGGYSEDASGHATSGAKISTATRSAP